MNRDEKAAAVKEISTRLKDAGSVFAFDYRGISVAEGAELRTRLRETDTTFRVVKNRLAKRALAETDAGELEELLNGPTAIAFVKGDPVAAAKALATFAREHGVPTFKGGLMDGAPLDPDSFSAIARLPGLDVLHGQLVFLTASPLTMLARGLSRMIGGLAQQLNEIKGKGLVTGEDPPPATPEPSDDANAPDAGEASDREPEEAGPPEGDVDAQARPHPAAPGSEAEAAAGDDPDPPAPGSEAAEAGGMEAEVETDPAAPGSGDGETSAGAGEDFEGEPDPAAPGSEAEDAGGETKED